MLHTIKTSIWINFKNLRFYLMQYIMLVFIFPCSYLCISLTSADRPQFIVGYSIGLFTSMLFSLFINMQASTIANSNSIATIEQYATFQVRPLFVHLGGCVYHSILAMPLLLIVVILNLSSGLNIAFLCVSVVLTILFLSSFSMVLGGLFHNPNIASPIINMLYMIIVSITPIYSDLGSLPQSTKFLYMLSPFAHLISLFDWSFNQNKLCAPWISIGIISTVTVLLGALSVKRWYRCVAVEKLSIF